MDHTANERPSGGLCDYTSAQDEELRDAFGQLPSSIQAIVRRYATDEVLSTSQLRHLAQVSAANRCEALQMLYTGCPVAEVVYFLLLSSTPSSTRASTETVAARPAGTTAASVDTFPSVDKENVGDALSDRATTGKTTAAGRETPSGGGLRPRASANRTKAGPAMGDTKTAAGVGSAASSAAVVAVPRRAPPTKLSGPVAPSTAVVAAPTGRGDSVSTFITVSPISSDEEDEADERAVVGGAAAVPPAHRVQEWRSDNPEVAEGASPLEINRGLSYSSALLPATVSTRRHERGELDGVDTPRTATAPTPSVSPAAAPVAVVIPSLALHKVVGAAAAVGSATQTPLAATDRGASPSLRPPPNARRIVQYIEADTAHGEGAAGKVPVGREPDPVPPPPPADTVTVDLASDPRARALLDLYRRNVLKNEMELEKAYTELSYQRSSVSPCAPPPGGMDWKAFLAHVRQKVRVAETPPSSGAAVCAVKRASGGGRSSGAAAETVPLRGGPATAAAGRISRGSEKTMTPRGLPTPAPAAAGAAGGVTAAANIVGTPRSSTTTGTPRGGRQRATVQQSPRDPPQPRRRRPQERTVVVPPNKPCSAWDAARGIYITHPHLLDVYPFPSHRCGDGRAPMEPAPLLQPKANRGKGTRRARNPFCRSQTAVAEVPAKLRRTNTLTGPPSARVGRHVATPQRFERAATATTFTRMPSAPCGFTRTASATTPYTRLHSTAGGAGLLASPRVLTGAARGPLTAADVSPTREKLQRTPSRWEHPTTTETAPATARRVAPPRPAQPRTHSATGVLKRRPTTPRGAAHRPAAAAATPPSTTSVFERLTSNFYTCTTNHSNNNYVWRAGPCGPTSPDGRPDRSGAAGTGKTSARRRVVTGTYQRTLTTASLGTGADPEPDLCSPRPTTPLHQAAPTPTPTRSTPHPRPASRPTGSSTTRTAGRGTTAALVSPIGTPRSASYRKPAPIIEVRKMGMMSSLVKGAAAVAPPGQVAHPQC